MTGEKRTETRMINTLCIPFISLHPTLHALYDCREGCGGNIQCYSISFLFLFFFHQSSPYPNKTFFYLLVIIIIIFFLIRCNSQTTQATEQT